MDEAKFVRLIDGQGYTLAQIALLRLALRGQVEPPNQRDLPEDVEQRDREYREAIGRFNLARRKLDEQRG